MDKAEVIQVIRTALLRRGRGVEGDPVRVVTQYWSLEGELLAEVDPAPGDSRAVARIRADLAVNGPATGGDLRA